MTEPTRPSRTGAIVNVVLTLLAFGLLSVMVWRNRGQIEEVRAKQPDPGLIVLGVAVYVSALLVTFLRWHRLVRALGLPFRVRDAVRLGFIGNVFNLVIPGAVGGDVIKAAFLCREQEKKTQAVASMVIDRALGLLGLFVLAGIVGAIAWNGASIDVRRQIVFAWGMVAAGTLGLAVLFSPPLYRPLLSVFHPEGRIGKILGELVTMASAYRDRLGVVFLALGMAVLGHAMYVVSFYCSSRALFHAEAPSLASHFEVVPLVLFSTAIPMPFGALGVTEGVSEVLFRTLVGFSGGVVAMLGYRVIMYGSGLLSVFVYLANLRQVRGLRNPGQEPNGDAHLADEEPVPHLVRDSRSAP